MKKKAIISLVLIALLAFGIGAGSFAWFTSQATSSDNVFTAGTLEIAVGEEANVEKKFENIFPSWTETDSITIKNVGSLPLKFRVSMEVSDSDLFKGDHPLQIKIGEEWVDVGVFQPLVFDDPSLGAGDTKDLVIEYRLPEFAGNSYQGLSGTLSFTFDATQTENPGWDEAYTPAL